MRKRNKAFFSCAILAGALLAATGAKADECKAGKYTVSTTGPIVAGGNTQITYTISGNPVADHVATVVGSGHTDCFTTSILQVTGAQTTGNQSYGPAQGDPITGLGKWACHEEAAKINPLSNVSEFTVVVSGVRGPAPKSVVVKKGGSINSCEIVGIGDPGGETPAPVTEIIRESDDDCAIQVTRDRITGKVLHVELTDDSAMDCTFVSTPVENLALTVNTPVGTCTTPPCALGITKYGLGFTNSGCMQYTIGGTTYIYGRPCP